MSYIFGKALEITFQRYITRPNIFKIAVTKRKRKICNRLATANQASQKNHNRFRLRCFWA